VNSEVLSLQGKREKLTPYALRFPKPNQLMNLGSVVSAKSLLSFINTLRITTPKVDFFSRFSPLSGVKNYSNKL
jgi:hypothetical protein